MNYGKIILDLCGGTGSWSAPYAEAGYDVRVITLPDDVRLYQPPPEVWGVLAAPPCTHFSVSGAQYWPKKDADGRTLEDLAIVSACFRIILATNPAWWCLENPVGRLRRWIGPPAMSFNPCDYGDTYTKKTLLWGTFNTNLATNPVEPVFIISKGKRYSPRHWGGPHKTKSMRRSITPPGFAQAFKEANP